MYVRSQMPDAVPEDFRWPIASIDFEASGLGTGTYPIEAGLAIWDAPDKPIRTWSTLIAPTSAWRERGIWNPASEAIHNIPRKDLDGGMSPEATLKMLYRLIGVGGTAFCDGGQHDRYWLMRLAEGAENGVHFFLLPWDAMFSSFSGEQLFHLQAFSRSHIIPHRAGPDAVLNIKTFAYALGLDPEVCQIVEPEVPQSIAA